MYFTLCDYPSLSFLSLGLHSRKYFVFFLHKLKYNRCKKIKTLFKMTFYVILGNKHLSHVNNFKVTLFCTQFFIIYFIKVTILSIPFFSFSSYYYQSYLSFFFFSPYFCHFFIPILGWPNINARFLSLHILPVMEFLSNTNDTRIDSNWLLSFINLDCNTIIIYLLRQVLHITLVRN